ncbi:unnamed protein product [Notodromas monacha]|uniref:Ion transport domain-containing protein n=1 Tax=Notodromas monacha TaxID=399045 RepID=A0A7R9BT95_9CRUS|nr:unnamed protein product [Notodromas monacha]CAG0920269.1 unnamed protein product [Notodromas monacha]
MVAAVECTEILREKQRVHVSSIYYTDTGLINIEEEEEASSLYPSTSLPGCTVYHSSTLTGVASQNSIHHYRGLLLLGRPGNVTLSNESHTLIIMGSSPSIKSESRSGGKQPRPRLQTNASSRVMKTGKGWRSLHVAAERGHVNVVNALLQKGEQVDSLTNDRLTPLHVAVLSGKPAVVESLLGHGAQVELKGGKSLEAPLHLAVQTPDGDKCAEMLIKCGANVRARTEDLRTPLHIAARAGNIRCLALLLNEGAEPTDKTQNGDTALHFACTECHLPAVTALLDHVNKQQRGNGNNADAAAAAALSALVNTQNAKGETAAHLVAQQVPRHSSPPTTQDDVLDDEHQQKLPNKVDVNDDDDDDPARKIMRLLLDAGADVGTLCTRQSRETALHYGARAGNAPVLGEMLSLLQQEGRGARQSSLLRTASVNRQSTQGWSPLLAAADAGHVRAARILLDHHARVDVFDAEGRAALHLAAGRGHAPLCDLLLDHKAFVNAKVMTGQTALHMAATGGFNDLVRLLVVRHNAMLEALTLRKETPLHAAAASGQLGVCKTLVELGANVNAVDAERQTALHLAAENNHSDVVKFFLNLQPDLVTTANKMGNTCAHIAAEKGSAEVIKELLKFNKHAATSARNKSSDATPLHFAASGGHVELVKILLDNGASVTDENKTGETPLHLAARYGHLGVVEALQAAAVASPRAPSRKTGLSPIHVAAFFGEADVVQELLAHVPATVTSATPALVSASLVSELGSESGLTPLHMAAYSGQESVVRILLNSPGVQHDVTTNLHGYTPLHLACLNGHLAVVGLLLSRSTDQLDQGDKRGRTGLHLASSGGHAEMVALLLGQGADINATDRNGWSPLHYAAKAGHLEVVKLLVESGASPKAESRDGKIPLCLAAASERNDVVSHLLRRDHNTYALLEDKKFILDLMWCSRKDKLKQLTEFVLVSAAPVDTAAKLSYTLHYLSLREKDRSKDLEEAAKFAENMAKELLSLAAGTASAGLLLRSMDQRGVALLDILLEHEQKEVVAHTAVQKYLGEVWRGPLAWSQWHTLLVFLLFLFCPPVWVVFSLPLGHKFSRIPLIKFLSYLTSHLYFVALLILTIVTPLRPIWRSTSMIPIWYEWILLAWISGLLLSELTNPGDRAGLGWLRVMILVVCGLAIGIHLVGLALDHPDRAVILYIRNQFLALALLMCCVQLLDFLTFHYLFGPWAIIISNLMVDLGRFLVILFIFIFGFSMHVAAIYQPVVPLYAAHANGTAIGDGYPPQDAPVQTPIDTFELLFYALFGLVEPDYLPPMHAHPPWAKEIMKIVFGIYMMVTVVVLINLLIAMMSDTYQRIQSKSDAEWKFGLAKLIRNMNRTSGTPSPLNLVTKLIVYVHAIFKYRGDLCKRDAQEYLRTEHVPEDPYALDVAAFATGGWVRRFKDKNNKIGPKGEH